MTARMPSLVGALALATLALAPPAEAQCFTPDGLTGPCCTAGSPTLPTSFPPLALPSLGICWDDCNPSSQTCVDLLLGSFAPTPQCTQYMVDLDVSDCFGVPLMKGTVTLDYTRTWEEHTFPGGPPMQVWRFAAKVDLIGSGLTTAPCPVPSCMASAGQAFFYGYVDYVRDCITGNIEGALVLYHGCDLQIHAPAYSSIPGTYHPNRTYALVGPHTAANPFTPTILAPPGGVLAGEGLRTTAPSPILVCRNEEPLIQGDMVPVGQGCLCPPGFQPPQLSAVKTAISGACGGSAYSIDLFPLTPWYHLMATSIGSWTTGASYPGPEQAYVAEGLFLFTDSCLTGGVGPTSFDIFYGGITDGGYFVVPTAGTTPTDGFVDLASNYSNPTSLPITFPLFGKVAPTDHLIYVNF